MVESSKLTYFIIPERHQSIFRAEKINLLNITRNKAYSGEALDTISLCETSIALYIFTLKNSLIKISILPD